VDERHRIFISYSRRDFYFAEQLAVRLRRQGLEVWFDVHELEMGSDWAAAIDRGIAECDTFVLVASRAALEPPVCRRPPGAGGEERGSARAADV
jgi:TIR domain